MGRKKDFVVPPEGREERKDFDLDCVRGSRLETGRDNGFWLQGDAERIFPRLKFPYSNEMDGGENGVGGSSVECAHRNGPMPRCPRPFRCRVSIRPFRHEPTRESGGRLPHVRVSSSNEIVGSPKKRGSRLSPSKRSRETWGNTFCLCDAAGPSTASSVPFAEDP